VSVSPDPPYQRWADGVIAEWEIRRRDFPGPAESVYLGGGTPSLCPPEILADVLVALPIQTEAEITIEANPGTLTGPALRELIEAGVNRLSIGMQTFQERLASGLGRGHTVRDGRAMIAEAKRAGLRSWSIDLMFALPSQRMDELEADLAEIIEIEPPHVSLYGLTYEPGTPLAGARDAGSLVETPDEDWREQYDLIVQTLEGGSLERYEVSNLSLPGHESRHSESVWRGGAYAGLGPGAHGATLDGRRTRNHATFDDWMADPAGRTERPTPQQAARDRVLSTLRHRDGLRLDALRADTGHVVERATMELLIRGGVLRRVGTCLRLTGAGFPLADGVARRLCGGLRAASATG